MRKLTVLFLGVLLVAFLIGPAQATTITVDENGHGFSDTTPLDWTIAADPLAGGSHNALIYYLPTDVKGSYTSGDVLLYEDAEMTILSDVIRFIGGNQLIFYSGTGDSDLADVGFPTAFQTNTVALVETGLNGVIPAPENGPNGYWGYTPIAGQPGDVEGVTFNFISDVPLPPSVWLLGSGLLGLAGLRRFRKS